MGAGRFVGRVGGLAVAMGVGTAVSFGHGVAWAEDAADSGDSSQAAHTRPDAKTDDSPQQTPQPSRVSKARVLMSIPVRAITHPRTLTETSIRIQM